MFALPASATSTDPLDAVSDENICAIIDLELEVAVALGLITETNRNDIFARCLSNSN